MTGTNIDELLQLLNVSESILMYNSEIEKTITLNGGTVLYSYNNIIMASEISDEFYAELLKNPYIDYIQELPLKKYGEIDSNLIDQLDFSNFYIEGIEGTTTVENSISNGSIVINTGSTFNLTGNTLTNGVDGKSGKSRSSASKVLENNIPVGTSPSGINVTIANTNLTLSALTNIEFNYEIFANGSSPIKFEFIKPINYNGSLELNNNILSGVSNSEGIYNILITAKNNYGMDTINLTLEVLNPVKITNTNLQVYSKIGTQFIYTIECIGTPPFVYNIQDLPAGITSNNNIISGVFTSGGTYNVLITVSGLTSSDSKILTITSGNPPIITSSGQVSVEQYSDFLYTLTSIPDINVKYNILGILPTGLEFDGYTIQGIPVYDGVYYLKIKTTNPFGESTKDLNITVYQIGS